MALIHLAPSILASIAAAFVTAAAVKLLLGRRSRRRGGSNLPPAVPGWPLIGNLLQLREKKPHQTFARWAETFGRIYTIRTGASTVVVLNSTELAKEAMVDKFSSISTRKLSKALSMLTSDKSMVAMSDYGDFHKMVKRYIISSVLGANAQKQYRGYRDTFIASVLEILRSEAKEDPNHVVNFRKPFQSELFRLALKQALGEDVDSVHVEEFGKEINKQEIFNILVVDPMMGAIDVDWRDFFPYLRWVPNRSFEVKIQGMVSRRMVVMRALIARQKKRIDSGKEINSYVDFLLSENTLTKEQLTMLVWESIIETSDTTLATTEWAMFELARKPEYQDRLYKEIQQVCGSEKVSEEHLPQLPYLNAVFHETLRRYSPVPIIPLRLAHEDTNLGGFDIAAGSEIAINLHACNMDKKMWEEPEQWEPARFLGEQFQQMDMYKTMAFGAGKRVCAGSLQAMLISCTAIARLVQEFQWRLREGEEENVVTLQLTTHKLQPMHAYIKPRASSSF